MDRDKVRARGWRKVLDRGALTALAAGIVIPLLPLSGTSANGGEEELPTLCEALHETDRTAAPISLGAVRKAQETAALAISRSLAAREGETMNLLARPLRSGLPACRGSELRRHRVAPERLGGLRGARLYFFSVRSASRFQLPEALAADPSVELLLLDSPELAQAGELAQRLGRTVRPVPPALAQALGVRCTPSLAVVPGKGQGEREEEVRIHELE